jgi:hypothetical protein
MNESKFLALRNSSEKAGGYGSRDWFPSLSPTSHLPTDRAPIMIAHNDTRPKRLD